MKDSVFAPPDHLHAILKAATGDAYRSLRSDHPDEHFYAFGLSIDHAVTYILPTANSEEALLRRSHGFAKTPLRWSSCDWEYHLHGSDSDTFSEIAELVSTSHALTKTGTSPSKWDERYEQFLSLCVLVLRELDGEGLFGSGVEREVLLVNVFLLDQDDDESIDIASQLNPDQVVERYISELEACEEWPPEVSLPQ